MTVDEKASDSTQSQPLTACSYLELVGKYPQAAGAALYVHKAFGIHFVTFIVCFTVMCSGLTSASAASGAFASNFATGFGLDSTNPGILLAVALLFMLLIMAVNLRGVAESVGLNVVLTLVELSGLLLVILIGCFAIFGGNADFSRVVAFDTPEDKGIFLAISTATSLAFFAMVGFEDSVNMVEEVKNPSRIFPRALLSGLTITAIVYVINMMMASRLLYGMSKRGVLPSFLSKVHTKRQAPFAAILFTTGIALALTAYVSIDPKNPLVILLGGTTSLLLLGVFALVNVSVLVLRREKVDHEHFTTPTVLPVLGVIVCVYLVLPWSSGRPVEQYEIAGVLLGVGVVLWAIGRLVKSRSTSSDATRRGR